MISIAAIRASAVLLGLTVESMRGLWRVVLVTLCVGVVASCSTEGERSEPHLPKSTLGASGFETVAVIGDSITYQGRTVIEEVLGDDYVVLVDGRSGFRVGEQLPAAEKLALGVVDQVIIELGTNDVMQGWDLDRSGSDLRGIVELFSQTRCIHLVKVDESISSLDGEAGSRARRLNAVMDEIAASESRVSVVDWPTVVQRYEVDNPGREITYDGVHPTEEGQQLLVEAYRDALASCPS